MMRLKYLKLYLAFHLFLMIYSTSAIFSKLAAGEAFLSPPFIIFYGIQILLLSFYALGWQQFIKRMPLSVAYANKAVTVIWGCVWGVLIFHEHLTVGNIIGGILVLSGIALYGYADGIEESAEKSDNKAKKSDESPSISEYSEEVSKDSLDITEKSALVSEGAGDLAKDAEGVE